MNVSFRPARADDAEALAPLVYSSGPAAFDYVFTYKTRTPALDFLRRSLRRPGGEFGYGCHVAGELDGRVVASGSVVTGADSMPFMWNALRSIYGCYGVVEGTKVISRGLKVERVVQLPKGDVHYISHIGVDPDYWGRGIGGAIMEHLIAKGRELGRPKAALDVAVTNPRAEALYLGLGFRVVEERVSKLSNAAGTVPNHRLMELRLD